MQLTESSMYITVPIGIGGAIGVAVLSAYVCTSHWPIMFSIMASFTLLILESIIARLKLLLVKT